jgi:7-carboxy-7-deazaguanine synthase
VCSSDLYLWARELIGRHKLTQRCPVLLSAAWGQLNPTDLAAWILRDGLDVRLQIQLHKLLWRESRGK